MTSLQFQMRHILYELYAGTNDAFNNSLWGFYTDERERMTYEAQLARGEFEPVAMIDEKRISAVLKTPWAADGKNFSQRLWTSREQLIGTLQAELTRALITGADSASVAKTIAQKMNAAEYAASRLAQTEITRIITESDKDTFAEMDIDEVEIVGTLDGHTCGTCGDMDGNHMPRSEVHAGTTAPPFHPNCRCVIVPYYGDEFRDEYRIMRDPETGKSKIVENMTFKEWKEKYLRNEKTQGKIDKEISGALDPYCKKAQEHANRYYGLVRKMKTDVAKIAKAAGMPETEVQAIKDFIFNERHDLGRGKLERFAADYMMAESWQRLIAGTPEPHDITLLKHEKMEKQLMLQGMSQAEAHETTSRKYNYTKEAKLFYGKIEKYRN